MRIEEACLSIELLKYGSREEGKSEQEKAFPMHTRSWNMKDAQHRGRMQIFSMAFLVLSHSSHKNSEPNLYSELLG